MKFVLETNEKLYHGLNFKEIKFLWDFSNFIYKLSKLINTNIFWILGGKTCFVQMLNKMFNYHDSQN